MTDSEPLELFPEEEAGGEQEPDAGEEPGAGEATAGSGAAVASSGTVASGGTGARGGGTGPGAPTDSSSPPRPGRRPKSWSVSQVNRAVRILLEDTVEPLWVHGEVANWTRARSGHCYFTLKDENAQLRCVMFRTEASMLPIDPEEGMTVRGFGALTLYEGRGDFQLVVRRIEGEGEEGLWRLAFQKLKEKLDAEGLTAPERKRPIPRFPERIGVVTSPTGAALRDIVSVIRRRAPWTRLILRGTRVQGEGASEEIARAIRTIAAPDRIDVLIVGRGGGSIEDLWAFNEEPVARAIAECPVPVISAVGHEVDVTISDLVADLRAPTPSAAGEAVVPEARELAAGLQRVGERLRSSLVAAVGRRDERLGRLRRRLALGASRLVKPRRRALEWTADRLVRGVRSRIETARGRLSRTASTMDALSPLSTLRRGYAIPLGDEGRILRSVEAFRSGARFTLRVSDGRVECESRDVVPEAEGP